MDNFYIKFGISLLWVVSHEILKAVSAEPCRETYRFTEMTGIASTPGYPEDYGDGSECAFLISAPEQQTIDLQFLDFHLESESECEYDRVTIYDAYDEDNWSLIGIYCDTDSPGFIQSQTNNIYITFTSDLSVGERGFLFNWTFHLKSCQQLLVQGFIFDDMINGNYSQSNDSCEGKPIYVQDESPNWELFYEGNWYISDSTKTCQNIDLNDVEAYVNDDSLFPEDIVAPWVERNHDGVWMLLNSSNIVCTDSPAKLSKAAVIGISVSVVFVVLVIVIVIPAVTNAKRKAKQRPEDEQPTTNPITVSAFMPMQQGTRTFMRDSVTPSAPPLSDHTNLSLGIGLPPQENINDESHATNQPPVPFHVPTYSLPQYPEQPSLTNPTDLPPAYEEVMSLHGQTIYPTVKFNGGIPPLQGGSSSNDASNLYHEQTDISMDNPVYHTERL